jgi:hypothetical protein
MEISFEIWNKSINGERTKKGKGQYDNSTIVLFNFKSHRDFSLSPLVNTHTSVSCVCVHQIKTNGLISSFNSTTIPMQALLCADLSSF